MSIEKDYERLRAAAEEVMDLTRPVGKRGGIASENPDRAAMLDGLEEIYAILSAALDPHEQGDANG